MLEGFFRKKTLRQRWNTFRTTYGRFSETVCRHDPADIMVFITTRCNLKCTTCPFTHSSPYSPPPNVPDISLELFTDVLKHYSGATVVGLVGGEPLLHPHVFELIEIAARFKMVPDISTNGILLTADTVRRLLDSPLGFLNVSLDAATPEEYESMRGGDSRLFRKILDNIRAFSDLREQANSSVKLWISCVISRKTIQRIPDYAKFARDLGADRLFCQNVLSYQCSELTSGTESIPDTPEFREMLSALSLPEGIQVVLPPLVPLDDDCRCVTCKHPFRMLTFDGAGNLSPCCVIPPHPDYGNLVESMDTWRNGRALQEIRREMLSAGDAFADICLDCWERFSLGKPHDET